MRMRPAVEFGVMLAAMVAGFALGLNMSPLRAMALASGALALVVLGGGTLMGMWRGYAAPPDGEDDGGEGEGAELPKAPPGFFPQRPPPHPEQRN